MRAFAICMMLIAAAAHAQDAGDLPKRWDAGETLRARDLNNNFSHIHGAMYGPGHKQVSNADIAVDAGIPMSALDAPQVLPSAWVYVPICTTGRCTLGQSEGVADVNWSATGIYTVTLLYTPVDASLFGVATPAGANAEHSWCYTTAYSATAPHLLVYCWSGAAGAASDKAFNLAVWDMNNAVY